MGCDIHMYVEYKSKESDRWYNFGDRVNPGRNYSLFGKLAGVRGSEKLFEPKGLPSDLSWNTEREDRFFITETGGDGYVTIDQATKWVNAGYSKLVDEKWVTNPDHHSHSWLSTEDFSKAIGDSEDIEYLALLSSMETFEKKGYDCRVVFWFDN